MSCKSYMVSGYWKDDKSRFEGQVVKEEKEGGGRDEGVFYYGLNEVDIKKALKLGEKVDLPFVIRSYMPL